MLSKFLLLFETFYNRRSKEKQSKQTNKKKHISIAQIYKNTSCKWCKKSKDESERCSCANIQIEITLAHN